MRAMILQWALSVPGVTVTDNKPSPQLGLLGEMLGLWCSVKFLCLVLELLCSMLAGGRIQVLGTVSRN